MWIVSALLKSRAAIHTLLIFGFVACWDKMGCVVFCRRRTTIIAILPTCCDWLARIVIRSTFVMTVTTTTMRASWHFELAIAKDDCMARLVRWDRRFFRNIYTIQATTNTFSEPRDEGHFIICDRPPVFYIISSRCTPHLKKKIVPWYILQFTTPVRLLILHMPPREQRRSSSSCYYLKSIMVPPTYCCQQQHIHSMRTPRIF